MTVQSTNKVNSYQNHRPLNLGFVLAVVFTLIIFCTVVSAQFDSGSDGSDGALDYTPFAPAEGESAVTVVFDPNDPTTFDHPTDPDVNRVLDDDPDEGGTRDGVGGDDNIYHFTSITVPAGIIVRLSADVLGSRPVIWLASEAVQIDGTLDLNGENGHNSINKDSKVKTPFGRGRRRVWGQPRRDTRFPAASRRWSRRWTTCWE